MINQFKEHLTKLADNKKAEIIKIIEYMIFNGRNEGEIYHEVDLLTWDSDHDFVDDEIAKAGGDLCPLSLEEMRDYQHDMISAIMEYKTSVEILNLESCHTNYYMHEGSGYVQTGLELIEEGYNPLKCEGLIEVTHWCSICKRWDYLECNCEVKIIEIIRDGRTNFAYAVNEKGDNVFQVCCDDEGMIDPEDCGWDDGICGEYNYGLYNIDKADEVFHIFIKACIDGK